MKIGHLIILTLLVIGLATGNQSGQNQQIANNGANATIQQQQQLLQHQQQLQQQQQLQHLQQHQMQQQQLHQQQVFK